MKEKRATQDTWAALERSRLNREAQHLVHTRSIDAGTTEVVEDRRKRDDWARRIRRENRSLRHELDRERAECELLRRQVQELRAVVERIGQWAYGAEAQSRVQGYTSESEE